MSPSQARQAVVLRLVGCLVPGDLKNADILDPTGELIGAGEVSLRLSRLGPKLQFSSLNEEATNEVLTAQSGQSRVLRSRNDPGITIHFQQSAVVQRKGGDGQLPPFFADRMNQMRTLTVSTLTATMSTSLACHCGLIEKLSAFSDQKLRRRRYGEPWGLLPQTLRR